MKQITRLEKMRTFQADLEQSAWGISNIGTEVRVTIDREQPAVEIEPIFDSIRCVEYIIEVMGRHALTCYFTSFGCEKFKMRII